MTLDDIKIKKVVSVGPTWTIVHGEDNNEYRVMGGTLAWRNNNPGNIKYGEFARDFGALPKGWEGHAIFPTRGDGEDAMRALLFSREGNYYNLSIKDAIAKYAPLDDPNPAAHNDPSAYAKFVAEAADVSPDTILIELGPKHKEAVLAAMKKFEGYRTGVVEKAGVAYA
jgi:hypothetical protein